MSSFQFFLIHRCGVGPTSTFFAPAGKAQPIGHCRYRERLAVQISQLFAGGCQNFAPSFRDNNHVFDPHAPLAGNVNSGLNRDHHARLQNFSLPPANPGRFVNFQALRRDRLSA